MAYKKIRRLRQEVSENEGAARKMSHAPDLSQIQTDRHHMTADDALALQDVIGNRAVNQLTGATPFTASARMGYVQPKAIPAQPMRPGGSLNAPAYAHLRSKLAIQPKLSVGAAHDPSEQEADRVASEVTDSHAPANQVQQKPQIQRASWDGSFDTNADFESQVNQQSGGGKPLPSDVRADLEPKFGADFSGVKVHTDAKAAQLSQDVGAQAFTHGSDIYFNQGKYNPESSSGKHLLAHELTHTVQQGASGVQRNVIRRNVTDITWNTATEAKPSALGVKGGVFFITVNGTRHVVKATENVGATKFSEQLVAMLGGPNIATTDSIPVPQSDNEFGAIIQAIHQLTPPQPQQNDFNTQQEFQEASEKYNAYITKYNSFVNSPYLMIQQNMFSQGTQVLGVEDLMEDIRKAGGNKGALQGRVDTDVQAQVTMLTNQTRMKSVGRLLAIDTLFGNADRFEEMNVQNAFMRGDNTIGAIDTEAIMQSFQGAQQWLQTDIGQNALPLPGGSDVERYVEFVIGNMNQGGGRSIENDWNSTPSSNVAKVMTNFDAWFRSSFTKSFTRIALDPMIKTKFDQLGFPEDINQGLWPQVKQNIRDGFDEGLDAIQTAMNGPQYGQIKQNYQDLSQQYGANDNFAWDAFRVRGEYMSAVKGGMNPDEAKQMIVDRMTRRENAKVNINIPAKVLRVLNFGLQHGMVNGKEAMQIKKHIQQVLPKDLKNMLHVSSRAKLKQNQEVDNRLEAARVCLLKRFVTYIIGNGESIPQATLNTIAAANRLRKKDVDQGSYLTDKGLLSARLALKDIGVDVDTWGPFLNEKQMQEQLGLDSKTVKNLKQRGNQRSNK